MRPTWFEVRLITLLHVSVIWLETLPYKWMKSNIDAACRQRIWPTAKRELKGKEGTNEWKLTLAWYVISFVTYGILKRIPNCDAFSFTLIQSECVGNVEAVRGIVLCKCLTRRKEIYTVQSVLREREWCVS